MSALTSEAESPKFGRTPEILEDLRCSEKRFSRYATPIQANAAQVFTFDNAHFEPELRGADRGDVTARSGPDNQDVKRFRHEIDPLFCLEVGA